MNTRQWIWFSVRCAISAALLYVLFSAVDLEVAHRYIVRIGWTPLVVTAFAFLIATFLNTVRWYLLLVIQQHKTSLWKLCSYNLANAFYVIVLPGGKISAEAMRIYQVVKDSRDPHAAMHAASAAFIDRMVGFGVFVAIVVLFFLYNGQAFARLPQEFLFVAGGITAVALLSVVIISPSRIVRLFQSRLSSAAHFSVSELGAVYRNRIDLILLALAVSVASSAIYAGAVYVVALSLSHTLSYEVALAAFSIGMISSFVPITLGGIGLREGALAGALITLANIPVEAAAVISFAMLSSSLMVAVLGGLVELRRHFL